MHRHGYKGRKFGRERDQRNALQRGQLRSLFIHGAITTTLPKAKELRPTAEKMITRARGGTLADRRAVIAALGNDIVTGHLLVDVIAPVIKRDSGYLRIVKLDEARVGDNAEMARIEFVDLDEIKKVLEKSEAETSDKPVILNEVKNPRKKAEDSSKSEISQNDKTEKEDK
jgi:large subunit ribosomal protein L17